MMAMTVGFSLSNCSFAAVRSSLLAASDLS